MVAMEPDGVSDSAVMANDTSKTTSLRTGQTTQGTVVQIVIAAGCPLYPTVFNHTILLWGLLFKKRNYAMKAAFFAF